MLLYLHTVEFKDLALRVTFYMFLVSFFLHSDIVPFLFYLSRLKVALPINKNVILFYRITFLQHSMLLFALKFKCKRVADVFSLHLKGKF